MCFIKRRVQDTLNGMNTKDLKGIMVNTTA